METTLHHKNKLTPEETFPPLFLRTLMSELCAKDGDHDILGQAQYDHSVMELHSLADTLTDPNRTLPLVLICSPKGGRASQLWRQYHWPIFAQLQGMCAVHILEPNSRLEVTALLPTGIHLRTGYATVVPPFAQKNKTGAAMISLEGLASHADLKNDVVSRVLQVECPDRVRALINPAHKSLMQLFRSIEDPGGGAMFPSEHSPHITEEEERCERIARLRKEVGRLKKLLSEKNKNERLLEQEARGYLTERDSSFSEIEHLKSENAWLRDQAAHGGMHWLAGARFHSDHKHVHRPMRVADFLERITDNSSFPNLYFTLDESNLVDLTHDAKKESLWITRAWEALEALNDWGCYHQDNPGKGMGFVEFLKNGPARYRKIPPKRVGSSESDTVRNNEKLSAQRAFAVPTDLDPSGKALMYAHIKLDSDYGICPRLYFLPDLSGHTPRVIIGYIGRHLKTATTN